MPKKRKKRVSAVCEVAGRSLVKTGNPYSAKILSKCGWRKKGAKAQRSSAMKKAWNTSPKLKARKLSSALKKARKRK
jgi:hypothetical protein